MHVVILGSGAMGLAAAYQAIKDGHEVTVLEADSQPGGMAAHFDFGGLSIERYYHFICKTDYPTFEILRELGIENKLRWKATTMGLYMDGKVNKWGDPLALLRFRGMGWLDKFRYALLAFVSVKRDSWPSLERRSAKEWIVSWCGEGVYQMHWKPLFQHKFYEFQDHISAAWIWTRIRRIGRSRRSMMQEELGYLEGGSETLVKALVSTIEEGGGKIVLSMAATRVVIADGQVTGVETASGFISADRVISTVPTPFISRLVPDLAEEMKRKYDAIPNIGICCLVFKLKQALTPHFWINFVDPKIEIPGMIEFSNLRDVDGAIIYVPYYMPTTHEKFSWSDEKLLGEAFQAMQHVQPKLAWDDVLDTKVARLRYAQPICAPGFASMLPPVQTLIKGLQIADTCFYYPEDRGIAESIKLGRQMARNLFPLAESTDLRSDQYGSSTYCTSGGIVSDIQATNGVRKSSVTDLAGLPAKVPASKLVWIFLISSCVLFLCMSRDLNLYDEGFVLTDAMRVGAGQLPHRDFYVLYGPAHFYLLSGLFKLFGTSILVERLLDLISKSLLITALYSLGASYCRGFVAFVAPISAFFWMVALGKDTIGPLQSTALLTIATSILIMPAMLRTVSWKQMFVGGLFAGLTTLVRYDCGFALLVVHATVIAIGVFSRGKDRIKDAGAFGAAMGPYITGFLVITFPVLLLGLYTRCLQPMIWDVVKFPAKYYQRGRGLRFPGIGVHHLGRLEIYLPLAIALLGLSVTLPVFLRARRSEAGDGNHDAANRPWQAFVVCFGVLTLIMYFKGFVRVSFWHMYLSFVPSLLVIAVLFQYRMRLARAVRAGIVGLLVVSVYSPAVKAFVKLREIHRDGLFLVGAKPRSAIQSDWCKSVNPLTRGACFLPDVDRMQAIEFIREHSKPGETLFSGTTRTDKVYTNDNLIYFATERLPATKWGEFDPFLQNTVEIQTEMVQELELHAPPYAVLEAELEKSNEPNESRNSTGVTLLDSYLREKYHRIVTFGKVEIWQRTMVRE